MRFYNDIIKVRKSVKILEMQVIIYLTIEVKGHARNYLSRKWVSLHINGIWLL